LPFNALMICHLVSVVRLPIRDVGTVGIIQEGVVSRMFVSPVGLGNTVLGTAKIKQDLGDWLSPLAL
jgi:hypothetical protein